jgi:hypothetical protein
MDLEILKKKISSYKTDGGHLKIANDELLLEILHAWERWTGASNGFYSAIGVHRRKMASIIGRAKKLKREGHFPVEEFKEIKIDGSLVGNEASPCNGIEVAWDKGKIIRFQAVDQLIDFLKKVA